MPDNSPPFKITPLIFILIYLILSANSVAVASEYLVKLPKITSLQKTSSESLDQYLDLTSSENIEPVIYNSKSVLTEWYVIRSDQVIEQKLASLQTMGKIQVYQENHVLRVFSSPPGDSLYDQQWYHTQVAGAAAWKYYQPQTEVILAIIDTGIDYLHPDLQGSLWVNTHEDLNGNGILDPQDLNGIDDDNNGYIDDVQGWDFTDAPRYRDLGDYRDPDNDPMDEYYNGHGTQIAGIIAAQTNNGIGISGLVPGVQIMNLRAGTAQGYLEEDDVAKAIVYAVENGARIINMSFGDVVVSPFLADAIRFAYSGGVVLVASAGNSGTNEIHYPAGFAETISVGATKETDALAEFSSWGPTLDLVAPGVNIVSTALNESYNSVNGTSFSAPIVSAGAAILLAENPALNQDHIRNLLKTNCIDLGEKGWDEMYGSGRIDLKRVAQNERQSSLMIHEPLSGSSTAARTISVIVSARDQDLQYLQLDMGIGPDPDEWKTLVSDHRYQIISDTLMILDLTNVDDTFMTLRLSVTTLKGQNYEYRSIFEIDRLAPSFSDLKIHKLVNENRNAALIEFTANEITTGELYYRQQSSSGPFQFKSLAYATTDHRILMDAPDITGDLEFYVVLRDRAGLVTIADNDGDFYKTSIDGKLINDSPVQKMPWQIPSGHALPEVTDFDQDGWGEIVISVYDEQGNYGPLQVYEFDGDGFQKIYESDFPSIPRSYGDPDNDGKMELLVGYGSVSRLLEVSGINPLTMQIIRQDTGYWASNIDDCDSDGKYELIMRYEKTYRILENTGDNQYSEVFVFENPSSGNNSLGSPATHIIDLDGDGYKEFIFGDYDGDVVIFENTGNNAFEWRHTERLSFNDATNYMITGTYDQNENPILIAGTHTDENINYEHEFDARYWQFRVLKSNSDNTYQNLQDFSIYDYTDLRLFDSGFSAGVLQPFGSNSFILAPAPNLYVCQFLDGLLTPVWHTGDVQTNTIIINDFDQDGVNEFYYNNGDYFAGYVLSEGNRPVPPGNFSAVPLDSSKVELTWYTSVDHDKYIIYKGLSETELTVWDSTGTGSSYIDSLVIKDSTYFYAVQVIDNSFEISESALSRIQFARPNSAPVIDSVIVVNENQIRIFFDEYMDVGSFKPENFLLKPGNKYAGSAISADNSRACILSYTEKFIDQTLYQLKLTSVTDIDRTNIDDRYSTIEFYYQDMGDVPYIEKWNYSGFKTVDVSFNMPMDTVTIFNLENYQVLPEGNVTQVTVMDSEYRYFRIHMSAEAFTGASGVSSYLEMNNLKSIQGRLFSAGSRISLVRPVQNIDNMYVYPQPARVSQDWLGFANVTSAARVDIFDLHGRKIKSLHESDGNGGIRWDLTNERGEKIAAGIYFFHARSGDNTKTGKFSIIR